MLNMRRMEIAMIDKIKNASERNRFTRMCIGEAIVKLMQSKELDKIKVLEIVRKAGISRMTYYHYYDSKTSALQDYLSELIILYLEEHKKRYSEESFHQYSHILFSLEFFDKYALFFTTMAKAGLYSIMIDAINCFMKEHIPASYSNSNYELFYYAGGLLNIFIKWEEEGKRVSAEEISKNVYKFLALES